MNLDIQKQIDSHLDKIESQPPLKVLNIMEKLDTLLNEKINSGVSLTDREKAYRNKKRKDKESINKPNKILEILGGIVALVFIINQFDLWPTTETIASNTISATYHEVVIPNKWFADYSQNRMNELISEFKLQFKEEFDEHFKHLSKKPNISIELFQDHVEGQSNLGWVVKFEVETKILGYKQSKKFVDYIGGGFAKHIRSYKS
jgi:hypothetical protein